jgi:hypothetical protein
MVERKKRDRLYIHKVTRSYPLQKFKRVPVPRDQQMLSVVNVIPGDRITKGASTSAERRFLLQEEHRNAHRGKLEGCCQPAESAPDDYDGVASARFHRGPRFSQEYFSFWLSQYRKAISNLRSLGIEMRRSNTL